MGRAHLPGRPGSEPALRHRLDDRDRHRAARARGLNTEVLDAVKGIADRTIAAGHGNAGCVSVIEEMRRSSAKA
ncbi:imine reductase family protein [Streptomyces lydicus]|uniref:imine reductase family protein n=1 Tax=Streptomyces lydicus TaxID=47763 RepID=UPI0036F14F46